VECGDGHLPEACVAQRVERRSSSSAAVSRFFSANYVKAPSLTVAVSEIGEADADPESCI